MLYLSRLILNDRNPEVRRDLADCNRLHVRMLRAFPHVEHSGNARQQLGLLYRVESPDENRAGWCLLVQSSATPDWSVLPEGYLSRPPEGKAVEHVYRAIGPGSVLRFRLRANPTKRVGRQDDERWQGRRVALRREEEQIDWLRRKGEQHGFSLVPANTGGPAAEIQTSCAPDAAGRRRRPVAAEDAQADSRLTFGSTLFEGILQVRDVELFHQALARGIGSGKAFGFGLLSVGPVRRV